MYNNRYTFDGDGIKNVRSKKRRLTSGKSSVSRRRNGFLSLRRLAHNTSGIIGCPQIPLSSLYYTIYYVLY